jgi:sec-independent protein translocase protein TatA
VEIFGLGTPELILIAFLLLLFFGKDKLPGLARGIGEAIRELRDGVRKGLNEEETSKSKKN